MKEPVMVIIVAPFPKKTVKGKAKKLGRVRFDEPELEAAWRRAIELSKKHGTKHKY